jgi:putative transcriptional regulator
MRSDARLTRSDAEILGALEGFLQALKEGGDLGKRFTVRTVELELKPRSYGKEEVRQTRELLGLSQPLFARFLGVSVQTVRAWEQGQKPPSRMACRFLDEIVRAPDHWRDRLKEMIQVKRQGEPRNRDRKSCKA